MRATQNSFDHYFTTHVHILVATPTLDPLSLRQLLLLLLHPLIEIPLLPISFQTLVRHVSHGTTSNSLVRS